MLKVRPIDVLACAALALGTWLLYREIGDLWWIYDDFFHLRFVSGHSPYDYYLRPSMSREFPVKMFTPSLLSSLELDLLLFGIEPTLFYGHQLASLMIAVVVLYVVFRLWIPPLWCLWSCSLVVLSVPTLLTVTLLMARHYLEGLAFAGLSVLFFVLGVRRKRWWYISVSAICYFLAALFKEIYVPLPLILLLLPEPDASRLRWIVLHLSALLGYLAYRVVMIGTLLGGYGWDIEWRHYAPLILSLPGKLMPRIVGDIPGWSIALLVVLSAGVVLAFLQNAKHGLRPCWRSP